jgi:hypothetical protein
MEDGAPASESILPPPGRAPAGPGQTEYAPRVDLTQLLKLGDHGLGITDLEGQCEIKWPFCDDLPPLKINPGVAIHWWDGPASPLPFFRTDLPARTYDLYTDFSWRPRPAEWLFIDLRFTPGLYTDFDNLSLSAFRPRGHGLAIVALSEQLQFIGGLVYTNRVRTKIVPAGGVRWAPDDDTEFRLVFPAPRISQRVYTAGGTNFYVYLAGEFGGGAWAIHRADGRDDAFDYNDLRILLGVEAALPDGPRWHGDVGYVFSRAIDYASRIPSTFHPGDTLLFRVGLSY